jgi:hypothetical protein
MRTRPRLSGAISSLAAVLRCAASNESITAKTLELREIEKRQDHTNWRKPLQATNGYLNLP